MDGISLSVPVEGRSELVVALSSALLQRFEDCALPVARAQADHALSESDRRAWLDVIALLPG